ncbi:hypothetical protein CGCSCA4_v005615 [Colletotrichum siamense]|uniref:Uncharacterized protein n=1 Tax=Colletotrichum siamense TaxID=690259 RepID=A0A9P5EVK2_COLSI|nr:hypothetical protein CGCSCA4_v005615 [Colletotrichum siamense]KAF4860169.1 hypothetical protein CGCSCA2_v005663 [Colletotrichum siamense]
MGATIRTASRIWCLEEYNDFQSLQNPRGRFRPRKHEERLSSKQHVRLTRRKFQLIPVRETTIPSRFKCSEFSPSSEVIGGKYLYSPVPMDEIELRIPLEHLILPGAHSDNFWINTVPKKLKSELRRYPGESVPVIGWGIKVNEGLNWSHLLRLILVVIFLIGGCLGAYSAVKSDDSSAFGLGAFLTAVFAVYIPFQYYSWKEQIE